MRKLLFLIFLFIIQYGFSQESDFLFENKFANVASLHNLNISDTLILKAEKYSNSILGYCFLGNGEIHQYKVFFPICGYSRKVRKKKSSSSLKSGWRNVGNWIYKDDKLKLEIKDYQIDFTFEEISRTENNIKFILTFKSN